MVTPCWKIYLKMFRVISQHVECYLSTCWDISFTMLFDIFQQYQMVYLAQNLHVERYLSTWKITINMLKDVSQHVESYLSTCWELSLNMLRDISQHVERYLSTCWEKSFNMLRDIFQHGHCEPNRPFDIVEKYHLTWWKIYLIMLRDNTQHVER